MPEINEEIVQIAFDESGLDQLVADPFRFKQRLRIGGDAYAMLRAKNMVSGLWDTAGVAAAGAGIASSHAVATAFFAPTGLAAWLGLATAATPIGWVVAGAVVAGSGYYGATRWLSAQGDVFVHKIPKYINTPIDVLGAAIIDLLGSLALRVSAIDGEIAPQEIDCITDHFIHDWGFDPEYVRRAITALAENANETRVKHIARELARFQAANPDCNAPAMQSELMQFLRDVVNADGHLDEREDLAIEAIERMFQEESRLTLAKAGESLASLSRSAGDIAGEAVNALGGTARTLGTSLSQKLNQAAQAIQSTQKKS